MKLKNLLLSFGIIVLLASCGKDDEPKKSEGGAIAIDCQTFVTTDFQTLLDDLTEKSTAYSEDQSTENCKAYYASLNTYISSWKGYVNKCVPEYAAQFETYWATWEASFTGLTCE
ncbi:MAG: hypothetical protein ACJA08_002609 [Cyclobacteriaceae bacterium]|jgi:hypothetical protein